MIMFSRSIGILGFLALLEMTPRSYLQEAINEAVAWNGCPDSGR